jgi:hypothetical protein
MGHGSHLALPNLLDRAGAVGSELPTCSTQWPPEGLSQTRKHIVRFACGACGMLDIVIGGEAVGGGVYYYGFDLRIHEQPTWLPLAVRGLTVCAPQSALFTGGAAPVSPSEARRKNLKANMFA